MAKRYNTVKTAKVVDGLESQRARQLIDACSSTAYSPATEADIDLALGIGTSERPEITATRIRNAMEEPEFVDIVDDAGPDAAAFEAMAVADAATKVAE